MSKKNSKKKPLIDVVISNHNYGDYLRDCVESFQMQSLDRDKYKVVVVDDASTDNSLSVLKKLKKQGYLDEYYQVDFRDPNSTRNYGAKKTDSKYIHFFDSDDFAHNQLLESLLSAIREHETDVAYCFAQNTQRTTSLASLVDRDSLIKQSGIYLGSALITREMYDKAGGFTPEWECLDDFEFWMKVSNAGAKFVSVPKQLFFHRKKENSRSGTINSDPRKRMDAYANIHQKHATVTVFTPFNGKFYCIDMFLDNLDKIEGVDKIVLYDNSNNQDFHKKLTDFAKDRKDTKIVVDDTPHLTVPGNRTNQKQKIAIAKRTTEIYNYMAQNLETDYVLILEDDVIPQPSVVKQLMSHVYASRGIISSAVNDRRTGHYMVWNMIMSSADGESLEENSIDMERAEPKTGGVEGVGATSLACSLIPRWVLKEIGTLRYDVPGGIRYGTDVRFGYDLHKHGLHAMVDWDVTPAHISP